VGGNLYPEMIRPLRAEGCEFFRHGKGSDELWRSPRTSKQLVVPRDTVNRRTANGILRHAGLPKAF
jgi:predicted RNA binding protein YcfA (HicA-like mRNA interferase family)